MPRPNLETAEISYSDDDPPGYRAGHVNLARLAGAKDLAVKLYEIPPGEALCPYHYEYEEEWLIVLEGTIELRTPTGTEELPPGGVACFPPGPDGAHKTTNRGDVTARLIMFSSAREPAVAVYPDSDKIGVWPPNRDDEVMLRRADGHVDYYDGETDNEAADVDARATGS